MNDFETCDDRIGRIKSMAIAFRHQSLTASETVVFSQRIEAMAQEIKVALLNVKSRQEIIESIKEV